MLDSLVKTTSVRKASVIIVTGFLGAGKTTLINRILTADHGRRIAVIVNEFGEVGIDHHLLLSSDQEVVQMNNGCVCCTVRGDLVRSLFQLMEHRARFDTLVIETTGLAEPAPVAQTLYGDALFRQAFSLDGVVTVVDAKHVCEQLERSAESCEQIAFADLILLNKTDLVAPEQLDQIERKVAGLNGVASIHRTRNSELDLALIFDVASTSRALSEKIDRLVHGDAFDPHHAHDHHHAHNRAPHLQDIATVCIVEPGDLDANKVSRWFRMLLSESGGRIMRMKGILNLRGDPDQFLFQGVHADFEGKPGRAWDAGEERLNRLVFIGRDLDQDRIRQGFSGCKSRSDDRAGDGDPFGRFVEISPYTLDQIRYWLRQNFGLSKETAIMIKEVPCVKPECPPVETAIVAMQKHEPPRLFKVQKPINEITFDHIYNLIENPLPCC
ncbi:MAG: GTP-binding protein [Hyphomicrobiales bacterium]|nr:GTP-binding protein [Hyphomicrobiales bacterium]